MLVMIMKHPSISMNENSYCMTIVSNSRPNTIIKYRMGVIFEVSPYFIARDIHIYAIRSPKAPSKRRESSGKAKENTPTQLHINGRSKNPVMPL